MPVNSKSSDGNADKNLSGWLFFIAINLVALPFSAIQTFKGYEADLGLFMGCAVAALTTVFFIAINYEIARRRSKGSNVTGLFILYLLPLAFSFPGNFGAFYEQFAHSGIRSIEVAEKLTSAESNMRVSMEVLESCTPGWSLKRGYFKNERSQLEAQFVNPLDPGWGIKCKEHYVQMAGALGLPSFTEIRSERLEPRLDIADKAFANARRSIHNQAACFKSSYDALGSKLDQLGSTQWGNISTNKEGQLLNELGVRNDQLVNCVQGHVGGQGSPGCNPGQLTFLSTVVNTEGLQWAFSSAYVKVDDPVNSALATMLALVIDLGVVFFIFILFKPEVRGRLTGRR